MNSVPMEVPFLAGTVCMEIHHRFIGGGFGRIPCCVRGEVIERRAGEADHAVQSGQANRRQAVQPRNWHRRIRSAIKANTKHVSDLPWSNRFVCATTAADCQRQQSDDRSGT